MSNINKNIGINFFGPSETADGIGRAAALNLQCMKNTKFNVNEFVLSRPVALQRDNHLVITDELVKKLPYKINYFHFSARWAPHYFAQLSKGTIDGFYNIGYWECEVPNIPQQWAKQLHFFDEIWTGSSFCQQAVARSSNIPTVLMPHPIESFPVTNRIQQRRDSQPCGTFTFLTIANVYSDAERKNILFTIRAFLNAFGTDNSVKLVVKISNLEHDPILATLVDKINREHLNINIIFGYVENVVIHQLYDEADAYVSLHRAEGFGFTISDAISRGIPVLTTGYSGNMDFCNHKETLLVDYKLKPIGHERLRYKKDDVWAEPDMDSAVSSFKEMFERYDNRLRLATGARERVSHDFSVAKISELIQNRLTLIDNQFNYLDDLDGRTLEREVGVKETYGF